MIEFDGIPALSDPVMIAAFEDGTTLANRPAPPSPTYARCGVRN